MTNIFFNPLNYNNLKIVASVVSTRQRNNEISISLKHRKTFFIELLNYWCWLLRETLFEEIFENIFFFSWQISDINLNSYYFINNDIIQLLSENKIFLSKDISLNDFMYYKHVIKYKKQNKQDIISTLNLSSDFFEKQTLLLKWYDNTLWSQIPRQNQWVYEEEDLFTFSEYDDLPFDENIYLDKSIESSMYSYDIYDWWFSWDLKSNYWEEPFFFFRPAIK